MVSVFAYNGVNTELYNIREELGGLVQNKRVLSHISCIICVG